MRYISMMLAEEEIARIEEGVFKKIMKCNGFFIPNFEDWYNDSFYNIPNSKTFDQRYELVRNNNYFCYSKPDIRLIARDTEVE